MVTKPTLKKFFYLKELAFKEHNKIKINFFIIICFSKLFGM